MSKKCFFCGKQASKGNSLTRRGLAKKKGGVGKKITGIAPRKFKPNLQRVKTIFKGKTLKVWSCVKCIKKGRVTKPPLKSKQALTPQAAR